MTTDTETYTRLEQDGREWLEGRARHWAKEAREQAERATVSTDARGRSGRKAEALDAMAKRWDSLAEDTTRSLWIITIGGYGEFCWVGTAASAHGRRIAKLQWEGGYSSRCEVLRAARPEEPNGATDYRPHESALASVVSAEVA